MQTFCSAVHKMTGSFQSVQIIRKKSQWVHALINIYIPYTLTRLGIFSLMENQSLERLSIDLSDNVN